VAQNSIPDCFFCGHPMKVASAKSFVCPACGMAEFGSTAKVQQPQQQQQQPQQQEHQPQPREQQPQQREQQPKQQEQQPQQREQDQAKKDKSE
jgi:predicted RNA-binding Zn-ribbon protein involved in translation (DUF1610 family)